MLSLMSTVRGTQVSLRVPGKAAYYGLLETLICFGGASAFEATATAGAMNGPDRPITVLTVNAQPLLRDGSDLR